MEYWIWLNIIKGLGPVLGKRLLDKFGDPKSIYNASKDELTGVNGIGNSIAHKIISSRSLDKAYSILYYCQKNNIRILTYNDILYPQSAKEYIDAPILLYYKGTIKPDSEGVAIIGSRRCSEYGKEIAIRAAKYLAEENIPVISGMAKGIDSYAHISCIKNGGYTLAFLGCGVDIYYPSEHRELMDGIIENGAVISEYLPGTKARSEYFPKRNRLISSWSKKILLVEAAENSGALITANYAKSQGKEIFVPPHEIYSSSGKGSNKLIAEGGKIYLDPAQLLLNNNSKTNPINDSIINSTNINSHLSSSVKNKNSDQQYLPIALTPIEEKIVHSLMKSSKTIEEVSLESNIPQYELIELLSVMELEGKIKAVGAGRYKGLT